MSSQPSAHSRLAFLDMAKGILVILMVVYHSLNYTNQYHLAFRYLSFLPPSFILITGFLISLVYYHRFKADTRATCLRLLTRGLKLLLLFVALNIAAQYTRSPVYGQPMGVSGFFVQWHDIFVIGAARGAAFEVLLPIAYLLLLSPAFIWLAHRHFLVFPTAMAALISSCVLLAYYGYSSPNLNLLGAGMVGMAAGRFISDPGAIMRLFAYAVVAYAVYLPIGLAKGYLYAVQLSGACIVLALICSASLHMGDKGKVQEFLIRHGKYSLLAYIVQIGALQVLSRFLGRPAPLSWGSLGLLVGTFLIMIGITEAVEWARQRSRPIDSLYKSIFA